MAEPPDLRADQVVLETPEATIEAGRDLARRFCAEGLDGLTIFLAGDLGAGKTTFARGFLEALGHRGRVPSPTYTLIEPYELEGFRAYHIDLYRLADPREADDLGLAELPGSGVVLLVEWPEHAGARLVPADIVVALEIRHPGRTLNVTAASVAGRTLLGHKIA